MTPLHSNPIITNNFGEGKNSLQAGFAISEKIYSTSETFSAHKVGYNREFGLTAFVIMGLLFIRNQLGEDFHALSGKD